MMDLPIALKMSMIMGMRASVSETNVLRLVFQVMELDCVNSGLSFSYDTMLTT